MGTRHRTEGKKQQTNKKIHPPQTKKKKNPGKLTV